TVIGRVWCNGASREAFVLVWNGIFDAIHTITGKELNFKVFSPKGRLLGVIGDSEGAQAQGLGDVIILRRMNLPNIGTFATVDVDSILKVIWKTCIVHFNRGVFGLKAYINDLDLEYLLGFPYLCTDEEIERYYSFCADSTNQKVQSWWAHKLGYPWLLPSLNRKISNMNNRHWDLTPRDTNPIEGSHAQDNQVNSTNRSLLEAVQLAKELDSNTARVIKATLASGILENPNNSLEARFKNQSQRHARSVEKRRELETQTLTNREAKKLRSELKSRQLKDKNYEQEIDELRRQLKEFTGGATPRTPQPLAGPSNLNHRIYDTPSPRSYIDVDTYPLPPARLMKALNLFPTLPPRTPIPDPRSDFDYPGALNSDVLDMTLKAIQESHPMYPVGEDDEVLASDPFPML
ncbi:hypothetical protein C8F04DRAFT_1365685, partial [Mycena alexandri]